MPSVVSLVLNIAVLCVIIASLPLLLCSAFKFYKHKTHQIMSYRDPYYVLAVVLYVAIGLTIESIPRCLYNINITLYSLDAMLLIETMLTYGVLFLFCLKSYLLFFQQRYHSSVQDAAWKKEIDAQHEQKNFYIVNKNRWGSFSYVLRWISIPYLWLFVFEMLALLHIAEWTQIVSIATKVIFAVVPVLIFVVLTYQLGEFYDVYGIKREIFGQFLCSVLLFVSYGLIAAATADTPSVHVREAVQVAIFVLLYCCFAFSTVYHPLYLLKLEEEKLRLELSGNESKTRFSISINSIEGILASIRDERVFSLFMQHLVSEFATENLLFIVELCQIKHHYLKSRNWVLKISKNGGIRNNDNVTELANTKNSLSVGGGSSHNLDQGVSSKTSADDKYVVMDFNSCVRNDSLRATSPASPSQPAMNSNLSLNTLESNKFPTTNHPSIAQNLSRSLSMNMPLSPAEVFVIGYVLSEVTSYDMLQIEIPKTIPTSTIITGSEEVDLYTLMHGLHAKYVAVESNFEINIPFEMRENIGVALQHYRECQENRKTHPNLQMVEGDLFWIMDAACLELFRLLLGPFRRFQVGEKYQEYISSMEHQARHANVEFDQIVQERVRAKKPVLHAGGDYDAINSRYTQKA